MDTTDKPKIAPAPVAKHRISSGWIIAGGIVGAIVLTVGGRHLYFRAKINAEHEAIRKARFPVTPEELNAYYPVPQGENAAAVYYAAFGKFAKTTSEFTLPVVGTGKLPPRGEPLPKETQAAVSAYLAANAQTLELLHQAAAIKGCRFDLGFPQAIWTFGLHHLAPLRQSARLLELQALMKVEEGKPDEAAAATADSFAAAHALSSEPLLISQLVRMAMESISFRTLERVLARTALTDRDLADLSARIAAEDTTEPFLRSMAGERCWGEYFFSGTNWQEAGSGLTYSTAFAIFYRLSGTQAQDHLMYLKVMSQLISIGSGTMKDMRERPAALEKRLMQAPESGTIVRVIFPDPNMITKLLAAALPRFYQEELRALARVRAARAGIAVERFRMANGRLPDSLDELVPKWLDAVPTDPFDEQPVRYKKLPKGFVTYSIGPDLKDDGGMEQGPKDFNAPCDITFIVAR